MDSVHTVDRERGLGAANQIYGSYRRDTVTVTPRRVVAVAVVAVVRGKWRPPGVEGGKKGGKRWVSGTADRLPFWEICLRECLG